MKLACTALVMALLPATPSGTSADAGKPLPVLDADQCNELVNHLAKLALAETIANSADVKVMNAAEKKATEKLANEAMARNTRLEDLKAECPERYSVKQYECSLAAKTMSAADDCVKSSH